MENIKELLLKLLSFDTQNDDTQGDLALKGETIDLLKFIENRLKKTKKVKIKLVEYSVNCFSKRGILVAYIDDDLPKILLQGHADTVPFGNFKHNPLGEEKEKIIYGRGAVDMKGPISAMITAFEKIIKLDNRKLSPVILITSDEEARGFAGIKKFLKNNNLKIEFAICAEPTDFTICNKFKGAFYKIISIKGKAAHGSKPHKGKNAIYDSIQILKLLKDFSNKITSFSNPKFKSNDDYSDKPSLNVGKIIGGNKVNTVPENCNIEFEMRLVDSLEFYEKALQKEIFEKLNDINLKIEEKFAFEPIIVDENNNFIKKLVEKIKSNKINLKFNVMSGFSEATLINKKGIPTIVFGPGKEDLAHSSNEHIFLTDLKKYESILISFFN